MSGAQVAFVVLSLLITCAIIGGSVGSVIVDGIGSDDPDPQEFNADARGSLVDELLQEVEANPQDASRMALLANVLANDGRIEEAITWYERSLELAPDDVQTRLSFAVSLASAGKAADAEIQYLRILQADPAQAEAHYYLGELYRAWTPSRIDEAMGHYRQVVVLVPGTFIAERAATALVAFGFASPVASPAPDLAATPSSS